MKHDIECNGYHTTCGECVDGELKICCNEFGARELCNRHEIENHPVYKQIIKDSFGGVIYNVANRNKYDTSEIMPLWDNMQPSEKSSVGGIMEGAFNFLKGE